MAFKKVITKKLHVLAIFGMFVCSTSTAQNLIVNGGFDQGLTNWATFTTANGVMNASVANFDTTGGGVSSAARFNVGEQVYSHPVFEGGGISQSFNVLTSGVYDFFANVASNQPLSWANLSGGKFSLFVDNGLLSTWDAGQISGNQTLRSMLYSSQVLLAGSHTLSILFERNYMVSDTTLYADNVSVTMSNAPPPVSEPETYAMLLAGLGLLSFTARRRKQTV